MAIRATKKSNYESYLEVNLDDLFGKQVPDNSAFRQRVGQEIIDTIINRTESEKYLSPARGTYSKEYASTFEFKAFGKSKNDVNLTQSGDMLGLLDIIKEGSNSVTLGWNDSTEKAKATNHNFGVTVPKREFLGLTASEAKNIKDKFSSELNQIQSSASTVTSTDRLTSFIMGEFSIGNNETSDSFARRLFAGITGVGGNDGEG